MIHRLFFMALVGISWAQDSLSLKQVIEQVLHQDHNIQIQALEKEQASEALVQGTASFFPTLGVTGAETWSQTDPGKSSVNTNVGLEAQWILFDGFRMFAAYDYLQELSESARANYRKQVESTVYESFGDFSQILYLQDKIQWLEGVVLRLDKSRSKEAEKANYTGSQTRLEEVEIQRDRMKLELWKTLRERYFLSEKLKKRSALKGDTLFVLELPNLENFAEESDLEGALLSESVDLELMKQRLKMNELDQTIKAAKYWPTLVGTGALKRSWAEHEFENAVDQKTVGLRLQWNLFNGFQDQIALKEVKMKKKQLKLQRADLEEEMKLLAKRFLDEQKYFAEALQLQAFIHAKAASLASSKEKAWEIGNVSRIEFDQALEAEGEERLNLKKMEIEFWLLKQKMNTLLGKVILE